MSASSSLVSAIDEPRKVVFGIDLGTIQTRAAIMQRSEDGSFKPKIIEDIPSVVSFTKNGNCLVGSCAKDRIIASAPNTFPVTKCLIGKQYQDPVVQQITQKNYGFEMFRLPDGQVGVVSTNSNEVLAFSQIAALILMKIKELCETELKIPMKNVVITTPAYFTDVQVQATREAAQIAELNVLKTINEPTAAALAYYIKNQPDSKTVVVYDFGGTFKVSILEIRNGESKVKSTVCDLLLGGNDFEDVLMNYFVAELKNTTEFDVSMNEITMQWLKKSAEFALIDLCYCAEIEIKFYVIQMIGVPRRITLKLTRTKFEQLVAEFINKTIPLCHRALEEAKVSVSDIDDVIAVGGVSVIPKVRATVKEIFGKEPLEGCGRTDAVAVGAVLIGHSLDADVTNDCSAPVGISSNIPKPAKQTDEFNYSLSDTSEGLFSNEEPQICSTGIMGIITEEEADSLVLKHRELENRMDDGDVNFIIAYQKLISVRRIRGCKINEAKLPDELQKKFDFFKEGRDSFVENEIRNIYTIKL